MFNVENLGGSTFLSYLIQPEDKVDDLSLGMLTNNKIKGIAPILYTQMNEDRFIKYNISSTVSAQKILSGTVTRKVLLTVISGILGAVTAAEEYMVDSSMLVFDLEYLFLDVATYEPTVICLPVCNKTNNVGLYSFIKNLIFGAQFDQTEDCEYVAVIINYLNTVSVFSAPDFKKIIDKLLISGPSAPHSMPMQAPAEPEKTATPQYKSVVNKEPPKAISEPAQRPVTPVPPQGVTTTVPVEPPIINTPPVNQIPTPKVPAKTKQPKGQKEKKMSVFYLLQHYSKENVELYKQQKSGGAEVSSKPAKSAKSAPVPQKQLAKKGGSVMSGMNIPGQTINRAKAPEPVIPNSGSSASVPAMATTPYQQPSSAPIMAPVQPKTQAADFGNTTVLGVAPSDAGQTTVLSAAPQSFVKPTPYLVRLKNGEKIMINKPRFRIGKEKSYVDYFISDNTTISRSHADILQMEDGYYLVDLNSTNHTYINGVELKGNEQKQIKNGNRIRLANEEFDFVEEL